MAVRGSGPYQALSQEDEATAQQALELDPSRRPEIYFNEGHYSPPSSSDDLVEKATLARHRFLDDEDDEYTPHNRDGDDGGGFLPEDAQEELASDIRVEELTATELERTSSVDETEEAKRVTSESSGPVPEVQTDPYQSLRKRNECVVM